MYCACAAHLTCTQISSSQQLVSCDIITDTCHYESKEGDTKQVVRVRQEHRTQSHRQIIDQLQACSHLDHINGIVTVNQ